MMTWLVMVLILIGSAVMQTVLPAFAFLGQAKFPFLLAVVLYYALNWNTTMMLIAAFFAGFLYDVLSPVPLGYSALCFCAIGWIVARFRNLILMDSVVTPAFFGGVAGVGFALGLYVLLAKDGLVVYPASWVVLKAVGTGILGMICTPVIFHLAGGLDRIVGNADVKESIDGVG